MILSLPDEIICTILKLCNHHQLSSLSQTCLYLKSLCYGEINMRLKRRYKAVPYTNSSAIQTYNFLVLNESRVTARFVDEESTVESMSIEEETFIIAMNQNTIFEVIDGRWRKKMTKTIKNFDCDYPRNLYMVPLFNKTINYWIIHNMFEIAPYVSFSLHKDQIHDIFTSLKCKNSFLSVGTFKHLGVNHYAILYSTNNTTITKQLLYDRYMSIDSANIPANPIINDYSKQLAVCDIDFLHTVLIYIPFTINWK